MKEAFFTDRNDAGRKLAEELKKFRNENPVVLALPRGGLPVGYEVAKALEAPLDIVLVRKIGAPFNEEMAIGAVVDGAAPELVLNEDTIDSLQVPREYIDQEKAKQLAEIERRRKLYSPHRPPLDLTDCTVIVVDDGLATGSTMRAALHALRRKPVKKLVAAVPVAAPSSLESLQGDADEIICLHAPPYFYAVGAHYEEFGQLTDDEAIAILDQAAGSTSQKRRKS